MNDEHTDWESIWIVKVFFRQLVSQINKQNKQTNLIKFSYSLLPFQSGHLQGQPHHMNIRKKNKQQQKSILLRKLSFSFAEN